MDFNNRREKAEDFEDVCPKCGEPCEHTPGEMHGFALDAAAEATDWYNRLAKGEV